MKCPVPPHPLAHSTMVAFTWVHVEVWPEIHNWLLPPGTYEDAAASGRLDEPVRLMFNRAEELLAERREWDSLPSACPPSSTPRLRQL